MQRSVALVFAFTAAVLTSADMRADSGVRTAQPAPLDLLIRNARVMDGSGNPWMRAHIGIRGDRIVSVTRPSTSSEQAATSSGQAATTGQANAKRTIDAGDRLVTPGFIDVHSHAAEGLVRPELRQGQALLAQGVTTVVVNPDGGGPVDLAAQRTRLESGGLGPNVALLIGHGSVRREVIGPANRQPTADELERMRALVRRGMEQGAFGLSSGLFYTPGSFAKTEEVIELAKVAGEFGGVYTSHVRDEGSYEAGVVASVLEVIRIAEAGRLPGIVSHMKALGPESWGLAAACTMRIDEARARGVQVFADQYAYEASSTSLQAALAPGGVEPTEATVTANMKRRGGAPAIQIASFRADRSLEGKTLDQIAAARKVSPAAVALDIMAKGGASIVSFNMSEDDIRHIMTRTYTMTSSDGALSAMGEGMPHPRNNGAFARKLALYVRDRGVVTLEFAIRSMTSLPASVFGLKDRGVIREGAIADLAIFDPATVQDLATYTDPHHLARGMSYVLVNGVVVLDDGKFTTAMPGKVLRK